MDSNGHQPYLIIGVTLGSRADQAAVLQWMRDHIVPAYYAAPFDAQLEIRVVSDPPDESES